MIRTPKENAAYHEGYQAYTEYQMDKNENPYIYAENLHKLWINGYEMAQDDHREYKESQSPLRDEDYTGNYGEQDH